MNTAAAKKTLTQKDPPKLYDAVEPMLQDSGLRDAILEASINKNETLRYNSVRVLMRGLSLQPQLFYCYWDQFAKMIESPNGFHRSSGAQAIAYLSSVDRECRLDMLLSRYLGLLDDSKVMVTHYFIETLDLIYRARPDFRARIFNTLLSIDQTNHPPERRELLKADILGVFDRIFDMLSIDQRILAVSFSQRAIDSISGKTRKTAKAFAAKHAH